MSASSSSAAIVPYRPTAHFIPSAAHAAHISRYDPYFVLGLPHESIDELLELCGSSSQQQRVRQRAGAIRDAYRELASVFHPDGGRGSNSSRNGLLISLYNWLDDDTRFDAVVAAARLLEDLAATLEYRAACDGSDRKVRTRAKASGEGDGIALPVMQHHPDEDCHAHTSIILLSSFPPLCRM
jgi:hypothetical protein